MYCQNCRTEFHLSASDLAVNALTTRGVRCPACEARPRLLDVAPETALWMRRVTTVVPEDQWPWGTSLAVMAARLGIPEPSVEEGMSFVLEGKE